MRASDLGGRVMPDMAVFDAEGEKIGSVSRVYQHALVGGDEGAAASGEDYVEVKTGFLGLGSHYYIPFSAITDVTEGGVFVDKPKGALDGLGWNVDPVKPTKS
jgi:hypothetical protein